MHTALSYEKGHMKVIDRQGAVNEKIIADLKCSK